MHPADLETLVDRELRRLPVPRAPHTLLPRVLAAVREWRLRPWYAREWLLWPLGWQVLSIAALILLVAGGAMLLSGAQAAAAGAVSTFADGLVSDAAGIGRRVQTLTNAALVLWRALLEPFVAYAIALVVLMCLACAAFATALNHVALGGALQR